MDSATYTTSPGTPTAWLFELDAGVLCLDFVNTLSSTSGEHFNGCADLVDFAHQSALLTQPHAERLHAQAAAQPATADKLLQRAKRLRKALFGIFSAIAASKAPLASDLRALNAELASSMAHARVVEHADGGFSWGWSDDGLDGILWPIVRSAADLLTSETQRPLVRECGAGDCRWLFLDTSKNRTRQWCSMQSCGNREKARRHYQRLRSQRSS
jgi:predicted RNA-binding Zn ribbon-like protein